MKTIRLLYPDHVGGALDDYWFGARLLTHVLPENAEQPLVTVEVAPPDGSEASTVEGLYGRAEVTAALQAAMAALAEADPDRIITIGGDCQVSQAPFDFLHGKYPEAGIVWIDAHADVNTNQDAYECANGKVLGTLLGQGDPHLAALMANPPFRADQVLHVGVQAIPEAQRAHLDELGVRYAEQTEEFLSNEEIAAFARRFEHLLVHLDVDVLDPTLFHSTYFSDPVLAVAGSAGGRMRIERLADVLRVLVGSSQLVGLTVAEFLPHDAKRLHDVLAGIPLITGEEA